MVTKENWNPYCIMSGEGFLWEPKDKYSTKPPNICNVSKDGKYYVEYDKLSDGPYIFNGEFIDTRIPYEYRVKISEGELPNTSYDEWRNSYGED